MLNDNAKVFVAALRSGKYTQGKHQLRDSFGCVCVLGVGGDLWLKSIGDDWIPTDDFEGYYCDLDDRCTASLPDDAVEWLGLATCNGEYRDADGHTHTLTYDNDVKGLTFAELADLIESEPEGLFA